VSGEGGREGGREGGIVVDRVPLVFLLYLFTPSLPPSLPPSLQAYLEIKEMALLFNITLLLVLTHTTKKKLTPSLPPSLPPSRPTWRSKRWRCCSPSPSFSPWAFCT